MNGSEDSPTQLKTLRHLKCPLTPYQLFSPINTVFLDNLSYEDQLMGLFKKFNEFIIEYNILIQAVNELNDEIKDFPDQIQNLRDLITLVQTVFNASLQTLAKSTEEGFVNVLSEAKKYTDDEIAKLPHDSPIIYNPFTGKLESLNEVMAWIYYAMRYFALTAQEYDDLNLTASQYDEFYYNGSHGITAMEYDLWGKDILSPGSVIEIPPHVMASETGDDLIEVISDTDTETILNYKTYNLNTHNTEEHSIAFSKNSGGGGGSDEEVLWRIFCYNGSLSGFTNIPYFLDQILQRYSGNPNGTILKIKFSCGDPISSSTGEILDEQTYTLTCHLDNYDYRFRFKTGRENVVYIKYNNFTRASEYTPSDSEINSVPSAIMEISLIKNLPNVVWK